MASVMQGDAYNIPVTIKSGNGTLITPEIAACVEITVGQFTKRWPGQVTFDEKTGEWQFPVTQKQTFRFAPGAAVVQARVVFQDGSIMGGSGAPVSVQQSASRGTLPQPEKTEAVTGSAPKTTEVTIPTVHDIDVSLHSQVILSDPIKAPYIGDNGNWYEYDAATGTFVDTGTAASGTPPITPDTAGKYLTNDGSKAEWGEVNGTLRVNLNKNSNGEWIIDKTYEEIQKAIDDGQVVYVVNCYNEDSGPGRTSDIVFYYRGWFSAPVGGKQYRFEANYGSNIDSCKRSLLIREVDVYVSDVSYIAGDVNANYGSILKLGGGNALDAAAPNVDYALPILYVTITQDGQDSDGNPIYKSDKTYAEIKAAHDRGQEVRIKQVYTTGSFTSDIFEFLGIYYLKLTNFSNNTFLFEGAGIPSPEYGATYSFTFGQPVSECRVWIRSDNTVDVNLPMDFKTRLWNGRVNVIPQQYLIHLNEKDNGTYTTLVADLSFDEIKTKFERTWGSTVFSVVYDNEVYAVSKTFIDSNSNTLQGFDFTNLSDTKKRLSLNNNNYWTASTEPFTAKYFLLNGDSDGYYLSNEEGKRVFPRDVSNLYGLIQYIYYQGFEYTLLNIQGPHIDFLAINRDKYAIISVDIAASYGQGTVTWSGWKPICPNQTPEVTTADNGKFLRVVDGQWAADSIANAKGVSF